MRVRRNRGIGLVVTLGLMAAPAMAMPQGTKASSPVEFARKTDTLKPGGEQHTMIAALFLSVPAQAVPPPIEQFAANCRAPVYATDQLVCGDRELRVLDAAIAVKLYGLGPEPVAGIAPWLEPQADWFKRRSRCAFEATHRECASDAYDERMFVLSTLSPTRQPAMPAYRCGSILATMVPAGAMRLERKGKPVGAAVRQSPRSGWQPHIRLEGDEAEPSIVPSGGKPIRCIRVKD